MANDARKATATPSDDRFILAPFRQRIEAHRRVQTKAFSRLAIQLIGAVVADLRAVWQNESEEKCFAEASRDQRGPIRPGSDIMTEREIATPRARGCVPPVQS
jgi:hypothetical protein